MKKSSHVPSSAIFPFLYSASKSSIDETPYFLARLHSSDSQCFNLMCRYVSRLPRSSFSGVVFRIGVIFGIVFIWSPS